MQEDDKGMLSRKILKLRYLVFAHKDEEIDISENALPKLDEDAEISDEEDDYTFAMAPTKMTSKPSRKRNNEVRSSRQRQRMSCVSRQHNINLVKGGLRPKDSGSQGTLPCAS